jgi:aminoglycoside/choline kinase family phosphotransferase
MSEEILIELFRNKYYNTPDKITSLKADASERKLFLLSSGDNECIGVINGNVKENIAFIEFSKSFKNAGFNVPQIYGVSDDNKCYIEEYLGLMTLPNAAVNISREEYISLCTNALDDLLKFQTEGLNIINFDLCYQTKSFDIEQITFDENKFIRYYLSKFRPELLREDMIDCFHELNSIITGNFDLYFMYRDFQPRNIMLWKRNLYYLDYQSGRKGPLQYDVASFLYSGSTGFNDGEREFLLNHYLKSLSFNFIDRNSFIKYFKYFIIIRLVQMLGSYGYLIEKRGDENQTPKIEKALYNLKKTLEEVEEKNIRDCLIKIVR